LAYVDLTELAAGAVSKLVQGEGISLSFGLFGAKVF
jgi:hypothetical protein